MQKYDSVVRACVSASEKYANEDVITTIVKGREMPLPSPTSPMDLELFPYVIDIALAEFRSLLLVM